MSVLVQDFGIAVRQLREVRGWPQEQLAEHAGLNRSCVGEIECGRVIPLIVTAQKLVLALRIDTVGLLARCEQIELARVAQRASLELPLPRFFLIFRETVLPR